MIPNAKDDTNIKEAKESEAEMSNLEVVISSLYQNVMFFKHRRYQPSSCVQLFLVADATHCLLLCDSTTTPPP